MTPPETKSPEAAKDQAPSGAKGATGAAAPTGATGWLRRSDEIGALSPQEAQTLIERKIQQDQELLNARDILVQEVGRLEETIRDREWLLHKLWPDLQVRTSPLAVLQGAAAHDALDRHQSIVARLERDLMEANLARDESNRLVAQSLEKQRTQEGDNQLLAIAIAVAAPLAYVIGAVVGASSRPTLKERVVSWLFE